MAFKSRRRRATTLLPEITLTPLIDTALNLLIIFMVATPMVHNAIKVNLPRGRVKEDVGASHELILYIDKHEKVYINGAPVHNNDVINNLKRAVGREYDKTVYVKADRVVSYGCVTELVDQIKCIEGIAHVALATQKA